MFPSCDGETGGGEARETRHRSEAYRRVFCVSKEEVMRELGAPLIRWTFLFPPFISE